LQKTENLFSIIRDTTDPKGKIQLCTANRTATETNLKDPENHHKKLQNLLEELITTNNAAPSVQTLPQA
jgi:hypothetical protein